MSIFTERMKEERLRKGVSQGQMAKDLQTSQSTITMWEKGHRAPKLDAVTKMANYFGCTTDYLLGYSDHRTTKEFLEHVNETSDLAKIRKEIIDYEILMSNDDTRQVIEMMKHLEPDQIKRLFDYVKFLHFDGNN